MTGETFVSDARSKNSIERMNASPGSPASRVGRVIHDSRGNAVWDWAIETGVLAKTTAAELLRSLAAPMPLVLEVETERSAGWCGDPYNRPRR
jgi:hypothetical protein